MPSSENTRPFAVVVPTLGRSPWLKESLEALRRDGGERLETVLVCQGGARPQLPEGLVDRLIESRRNLGFAGGTNLGIAASRSPWIATVNDDAIIQPGWFDRLHRELEASPQSAAAQGLNLLGTLSRQKQIVDGRGLTWNRSWQAVQIDHGKVWETVPEDSSGQEPSEVFGVSATAALFRRDALVRVALPSDDPDAPPGVFDPALGSYYEDADLACRLRAAGYRALSVPMATVLHAGSTTGRSLGLRHQRLIYGNRYLVVARCLGSGLWGRLPRMIGRDLIDFGRAVAGASPASALGVVAGWGRALRYLPSFGRRGPSSVLQSEIDRLRV